MINSCNIFIRATLFKLFSPYILIKKLKNNYKIAGSCFLFHSVKYVEQKLLIIQGDKITNLTFFRKPSFSK